MDNATGTLQVSGDAPPFESLSRTMSFVRRHVSVASGRTVQSCYNWRAGPEPHGYEELTGLDKTTQACLMLGVMKKVLTPPEHGYVNARYLDRPEDYGSMCLHVARSISEVAPQQARLTEAADVIVRSFLGAQRIERALRRALRCSDDRMLNVLAYGTKLLKRMAGYANAKMENAFFSRGWII